MKSPTSACVLTNFLVILNFVSVMGNSPVKISTSWELQISEKLKRLHDTNISSAKVKIMQEWIFKAHHFHPMYRSFFNDPGLRMSYFYVIFVYRNRLRGVCKRTRGLCRTALVNGGVHIVYLLDLAVLNSHCFKQRCKTFSKSVGQRCDFAVRFYIKREKETLLVSLCCTYYSL